MSPSTPTRPSLLIVGLVAALVGGGGFLYMVKLMHDIAQHMGLMATQIVSMAGDMHRMQGDMASLSRDVSGIGEQVRTLPQMAQDMQRMREGMERMSVVVGRGGEQIQQMNPMGIIQQVVPGSGR